MDNQEQYNFIMNSGAGAPTGPAMLQNPKKRLIIAVLFVTVILLVVFIAIGIILNMSKSGSAGMKGVAAYQTEIMRVSELGMKSSKDTSIKAQISTVQSFVGSDLNNSVAYLGESLGKNDLIIYHDSTTDKALETALASNKFDAIIIEELDALFTAYQAELASTFNGSSDEDQKEILNTANENIVVYKGL